MNRVGDRFARWSRRSNGKDGTMIDTEHSLREPLDTDESQVRAPVDLEAAADNEAARSAEAVELEQLRGERDALKDRLARLQAEFDNARKREAKERQDARDRGTQAAVEPFLGVMDNFDLALKAEGSVQQLRSGVELILKQMDEALRSLSVQPVEAVGAQFDPRVHEALGSVETVEFPDQQVLEEIRRGYRLRDKLLRPALVRIASNPAQRSE